MSKYLSNKVCSHELNFSLLSLNRHKPKELFIKCGNCGFTHHKSIYTFLQQLKMTTHNISNFDHYCNNLELHQLLSLDNIISTTDLTNKLN